MECLTKGGRFMKSNGGGLRTIRIMAPAKVKIWAAVAAQWLSTRLVPERWWVQILPGPGLFSSLLYLISSASLIRFLVEVQHY